MSCITRYKDTNLKAIHNTPTPVINVFKLYYTIQRYKFESNSQPAAEKIRGRGGCITRYKDTNLKAIHNVDGVDYTHYRLYYTIQRYKFESNSQLGRAFTAQPSVVLHDTKIQI